MSFMKPYIYGPQYGWKIETDNGTEFLPDDMVPLPSGLVGCICGPFDDGEAFDVMSVELRQYCEGTIQTIEVIFGFFGRYSADGYMDCTPWSFDTDEQTLRAELDEMYGDESDESNTLTKWTVWLYEDADSEEMIAFDCDADDYAHAIEQAQSAYPNGYGFDADQCDE